MSLHSKEIDHQGKGTEKQKKKQSRCLTGRQETEQINPGNGPRVENSRNPLSSSAKLRISVSLSPCPTFARAARQSGVLPQVEGEAGAGGGSMWQHGQATRSSPPGAASDRPR